MQEQQKRFGNMIPELLRNTVKTATWRTALRFYPLHSRDRREAGNKISTLMCEGKSIPEAIIVRRPPNERVGWSLKEKRSLLNGNPSALFTVLRSENSTNNERCEGCRFRIARITPTPSAGKSKHNFQFKKSGRFVKIVSPDTKLKKEMSDKITIWELW